MATSSCSNLNVTLAVPFSCAATRRCTVQTDAVINPRDSGGPLLNAATINGFSVTIVVRQVPSACTPARRLN